METKADYITRQRIADEAERQTQRAADAMQQESHDVNLAANELLDKIRDMNSPERPGYFWRSAVQRVYERLGEVQNKQNNCADRENQPSEGPWDGLGRVQSDETRKHTRP